MFIIYKLNESNKISMKRAFVRLRVFNNDIAS